jgi:hypothetical protein
MKKLFYLFLILMAFITFDYYAENIFPGSETIEMPPGPFESEVTNRFEPDPNDFDGDGISNADEEKYGTDQNDPDTDGDGLTDGWEVLNGTDPNSKSTTGYLEVIDLATGKKDTKSSEDIIDINDQSPLPPGAEYDFPLFPWDDETYLPKVIDDKELENIDEYTGIVPPELENEEYCKQDFRLRPITGVKMRPKQADYTHLPLRTG